MIIPHRRLSPEALRGLIEEFVTRHGTDNGFDGSLDKNVAMVMRQLDREDAFVVYDVATETENIVSKHDLKAEDEKLMPRTIDCDDSING